MEYALRFVTKVPDMAEFEELLRDYYTEVLGALRAIGGPDLSAADIARETVANIDSLLPPEGRLLLCRGADGRLVACASLRRIRPDAVEMKRMFVRPEARGRGLGRKLFERRIEEARNMGCRTIYADTVRGNRSMLTIYERFGFDLVPRYPENANPPELEPFLVYLEYRFGGAR